MNTELLGGIAAVVLGILAHVAYARAARTRWGMPDVTAFGVVGKRIEEQSTWTEQDRILHFVLYLAKRFGLILMIGGVAFIVLS